MTDDDNKPPKWKLPLPPKLQRLKERANEPEKPKRRRLTATQKKQRRRAYDFKRRLAKQQAAKEAKASSPTKEKPLRRTTGGNEPPPIPPAKLTRAELFRRVDLIEDPEQREKALEAVLRLYGTNKTREALDLEQKGWRAMLDALFPEHFDTDFLHEHNEFWDWGWQIILAIRDKRPLTAEEVNVFMALWSRNFGKSMHCEAFATVACCVIGRGIFLYVSGTQDLANEHLSNIDALLTSEGVKRVYPEHSRPMKSAITGSNKAWKQNKIDTEGGVIVWAIGLNVGVRGIRRGKDRVQGFFLDDIDDFGDSPLVSVNKANTLGNSVLPTADVNFFVIGAQNLITEHSVFSRVYKRADMMLANRICSGPFPAFDNLITEFRDGRDMIISATPRWPTRVTVDVGQRFIDTFGLIRFLSEFQHDFEQTRQGRCFSNYDDTVHVITKSEFESIFGVRTPPQRWYKYAFHDWAKTKSQFHANICGKVAVSSQNEKLPGYVFLYDLMSFPAGTEPEDVALRFLKSLSPTTKTAIGSTRTWEEVIETALARVGLEHFRTDTTQLLEMRRAALSRIIPPLAKDMIRDSNIRKFRMSHEADGPKKVYRQVFGIPWEGINPGRDGGIDLFNHYLKVDYTKPHPFRSDTYGFSRTFLVVEDDKLPYIDAVSPERLHDSDLARYQFKHWRYQSPKLTESGEEEKGPEKLNDDFGNGLMMLFWDNSVVAAPLTQREKLNEDIQQRLPEEHPFNDSQRAGYTPAQEMELIIARQFALKRNRTKRIKFDDFGKPVLKQRI